MTFRLVTLALVALTLMSCNRRQEEKNSTVPSTSPLTASEVRGLRIQPVYIGTDSTCHKTIGFGTWVTDPAKGEYLISARHLFLQPKTYYIGYSVDGKGLQCRPIEAIDTRENEFCIGKIGPIGATAPTLISKVSRTVLEIERLVRDRIPVSLLINPPVEPYTSLVYKNPVRSLVQWQGMPEKIHGLDCYLDHGSSGAGFTSEGDSLTFWVVAGGWPAGLTEHIKGLSSVTNPKGFTLICGLEWSQIEEIRMSLFGK